MKTGNTESIGTKRALEARIVEALGGDGVQQVFENLGVEFVGEERDSGWVECRGVRLDGRPDNRPSACVNLINGLYKDSGTDECMGIVEFYASRSNLTPAEALEALAERAGLDLKELRKDLATKSVEAVYDYAETSGDIRYQVVRYRLGDGSKSFVQRRPDPANPGGFIYSMKGIEPLPYALKNMAERSNETVYICEGEKAADALLGVGLVATTASGGVGSLESVWPKLVPYFRGRDIVILPDRDEPGARLGTRVADLLRPVAKSVRVLNLPGLPPKGDAFDFLAAGGTAADIVRLAAEAGTEAAPARPDVFRNYVEDDGKRVPLSVADLDRDLDLITGGWPKRVGRDDSLFVPDGRGGVWWLNTPVRLFAWIRQRVSAAWATGPEMIPQEGYWEHKRMSAPAFDSIETMPHFPPVEGVYYLCGDVVPKRTGDLERLLDFFSPATPIDRDLLRSLVLNLFWGGLPGCRPGYLITAADDDSKCGRGVGKTKLVDSLSELISGRTIDVNPSADGVETAKTRLLSDAGRDARIGRIDNVKSLHMSSAGLESLITAAAISGRALYKGESSRPNLLTWILTVNGAALSMDLSQRTMPIQLARPVFSSSWESDLRGFIEANRESIIADVGAILSEPAPPVQAVTRWGVWEREVLARASKDVPACQRVILKRQAAVDDDSEERAIVRAEFIRLLIQYGHDPERDFVFLPSGVASEWLASATGERRPTNKASTVLRGMAIPELAKHDGNLRRGWTWTGPKIAEGELFKPRQPVDVYGGHDGSPRVAGTLTRRSGRLVGA